MRRIALLVLLLGAPATVRAADPIIGTWQLNLARSRYDPGPAPKSQTRIYTQDKTGIKAISIIVYRSGNTDTVHYPADYDGKEHPVAGSPDTDGIVMKRVDDYTAESSLMHAGKVIGTTRRTVSRDGKALTITYRGTGPTGEQVSNTTYYDRVVE